MRFTIKAERIHFLLHPLLSQSHPADEDGVRAQSDVRIEADTIVEPPGVSVSIGESGVHLRGFTSDAKVERAGFIFIPLEQICGLLDHIAALDSYQTVTFAVEASTPLLLNVEWKSGHAILAGLTSPPRGWKGLPVESFEADHNAPIPASQLAAAIGPLLHILPEQHVSKYALDSAQLSWKGGKGQAVVTDGHRLGITEFQTADGEGTIILHRALASAVVEISKADVHVKDVMPPILLDYNDAAMRIIYGEYTIYAPISQEKFPAWEVVIPKSYSGAVSVDRRALLDAITGVTSIQDANSRVTPCALDFTPNIVTVIGGNAYEEESRAYQRMDAFDASHGFKPETVFFNAEYLIDLLTAMDIYGRLRSSKVRISFQNSGAPSRFEANGVTYIVMPMAKAAQFLSLKQLNNLRYGLG